MNPISKTAFYCCGVRMRDAESERPVCNDIYAKLFMNEEGLQILERFKDETGSNASTVARPRIIDDLLREELKAHPDLSVVLIGAGFDSRAFRLTGGTWLELDEPQVIEYKNERLPTPDCKNELQRIPVDFAADSLEEKLLPLADNQRPVIVIIEGVFMYLEEEQITETLSTLRRVFPRHKLFGDLQNRRFFEKYGASLHEKLTGLGTSFKFTAEDPEKIFLENGYRRTQKISIVEKASEYGLLKVPKFLLKTFLRTLANGYAVYVFESH